LPVSGDLVDAWPNAPGKKHLLPDAGRVLMCQTKCVGDAELRLFAPLKEQPLDTPIADYADGILYDLDRLTDEVIAFRVMPSRTMPFRAGQFAMLQHPDIPGWRAYSMCRAAVPGDPLSFVIKRQPGGRFSKWLFEDAVPSARLRLFGPMGNACLDPISGDTEIFAIAGGSGIAGIIAVLDAALASGHLATHNARVFFGVRTPEDVFFADRLSELVSQSHGYLHATIAYSEAHWNGANQNHREIQQASGFVHEIALEALGTRPCDPNAAYFIGGPPALVNASETRLLRDYNVTPSQLRLDRFG